MIVVEQNVAAALSFANRVYGFNSGHVVFEGTPADLSANPNLMRDFLGVAI
jgi:branched-chain amino acid transport system ATP-binding protein